MKLRLIYLLHAMCLYGYLADRHRNNNGFVICFRPSVDCGSSSRGRWPTQVVVVWWDNTGWIVLWCCCVIPSSQRSSDLQESKSLFS